MRGLRQVEIPFRGGTVIVREAAALETVEFSGIWKAQSQVDAVAYQLRRRVLHADGELKGKPYFTAAEALELAMAPSDSPEFGEVLELMTAINRTSNVEKKATPSSTAPSNSGTA